LESAIVIRCIQSGTSIAAIDSAAAADKPISGPAHCRATGRYQPKFVRQLRQSNSTIE